MRIRVFSLLGALLLAAGAGAQSVSDQLKQRTGRDLRASSSTPSAFALPPGVAIADGLSAEHAVAIALWNNAAFQAELAKMDLSRADLVEAGQLRNPNVQMLMPVGLKPFESLLVWPIEEIFQRGRRIRAAQGNLDAVAANVVQTGLDLARDVRVARADAWLAESRAAAMKETAGIGETRTRLIGAQRADGEATGLDLRVAVADSQSAAAASVLAAV
jgi:cobalt-zinc-cadmium efflux system outer membrane protein